MNRTKKNIKNYDEEYYPRKNILLSNNVDCYNTIQIRISKLFIILHKNINIYCINQIILSYCLPIEFYRDRVAQLPYSYIKYISMISN